jgi:mono/diheme cytochrome c family protein
VKFTNRILFLLVLGIFSAYGFALQDGITQKKRPIRVILFWSIECPVAAKYTERLNLLVDKYVKQDVQFEAYFPQEGETRAAVEKVLKQRKHKFLWITDPGAEIAQSFGVDRVPTAIVISKTNEIVFSGMIDDAPERERHPTKHYLADALDAAIAGKAPAVSQTKIVGCAIMAEMGNSVAMKSAAYDKVHESLKRNCLPCHTAGGASPIPFDSFVDVRRWAPMIHETVTNGTMPPYGMPDAERKIMDAQLAEWRAAGRPGLLKPDKSDPVMQPYFKLKTNTPIVVPTGEIHVYRTIRQRIQQDMKFGRFSVKSRIPTMLRSADIFTKDADGREVWLGSWQSGMGPMPIFWLPKGMIVTIKLRYYSSFKVQQDQPVIEFFGDRYQIPLLEYQKLVPIAMTGSNGTDVNAEFTVSENMDVWRLRIQTPFGPNLQTLTIKRKDKSADQVFELYSMGSSWAQAISPMLRLKEGDKFILKITTKRPEETLPEIVRNRAVFLEIGTAL